MNQITYPVWANPVQDLGAVITASGATTTQTSPDILNINFRGIKVVLNTTVIGTGSVTVSIRGKDSVSGAYYTIIAGAAVVTNTTNVYTVFPAAPVTTNVSANDFIPAVFDIIVTANNANAATYTVGAVLM